MLKVRHLIIIAGPPCSGKSYLIQKIQNGKYHNLCEKINLNQSDSWFYAQASNLKHFREKNIEKLVLHYDIHGQYSKKKGFKHIQALIDKTDTVTILTLYPRLEELIRYANKRIFLFCLFFSPVERIMNSFAKHGSSGTNTRAAYFYLLCMQIGSISSINLTMLLN